MKNSIKRDGNILKSYKREIKMTTSTVSSKKIYRRKEKHQAKQLEN